MRIFSIAAALLAACATQAQETLNYSDGNPVFGGEVSLTQSLPANGTESVTPTSFTLAYAWLNGGSGPFQEAVPPSFQFTTVNSAITAWDISLDLTEFGTNTPVTVLFNLSNQGDSYTSQTSGAGCMPPPGGVSTCVPTTVTNAPGKWTEVPELDSSRATVTLMLLFGGIAVLRGSRPRLRSR